MHTKKFFSVLCLLCLISVLASVAHARTVVCESKDNQTSYCPADTRGGVRLVRQLSKAACRERETWGYDHRGIWVAEGCRAKFEVGFYGNEWQRDYPPAPYEYHREPRNWEGRPQRRNPVTLRCESRDNRDSYCRFPIHDGHVEVQRQLSSASCQLGRTWGWDRGGIWVSGGCRAIFVIY